MLTITKYSGDGGEISDIVNSKMLISAIREIRPIMFTAIY